MATIWTNGKFINEADFHVSPYDRALCHGLSLFETIFAMDGEAKMLGQHLERISRSIQKFEGEALPFDESQAKEILSSLLIKNQLDAGRARIRLGYSFGPGRLNEVRGEKSKIWITAASLVSAKDYISVTVSDVKLPKNGFGTGHKIGSYSEQIIGLDQARRSGFDELLFFNDSDEFCEAAMANIFLVIDEVLVTPALESGCLPGITRQRVIDLAKSQKLKCEERLVLKADLERAQSAFLTSSTSGVRQVISIDGRSLENSGIAESLRQLIEVA